jgi:hypothetical protein
MSASEKLKELKALHDPHPLNDQEAAWTLRNALPQIVAVVEAAETYAHPGSWTPLRDGQGVTFTGPNRPDSHPREIAERALSALEEALT